MERVLVMGAGPYGLAAAAHLRASGHDVHVFGEPMSFWERSMPQGMLLRSYWGGSHIADPAGAYTLDVYERARHERIQRPIPVADFTAYGRWVARGVLPEHDRRTVTCVDSTDDGLRVTACDGEVLDARRVVVATGIAQFAHRPVELDGLPRSLVSHTGDHRHFRDFAGAAVAVVGGGQSALECAALLHETGADVEVIVRAPEVHWLRFGSGSRMHRVLHSDRNPCRHLLFPPSDVGPPGINVLVDKPPLFTAVPSRRLRSRIARRAIRPAGAGWLRSRLADVPVTVGTRITEVEPHGARLRVHTTDGRPRVVDHLLLATGYRVDVRRHRFLSPGVLGRLQLLDGYPVLNRSFESTVPGLHFVGAAAAMSFGPLMRFVAGSGFAARRLVEGVGGSAAATEPRRLVRA